MINIENAVQNYFDLKSSIKENVEIAVVTKNINDSDIIEFAQKTGHLFYAENYTKELKKWDTVKAKIPNIKLSFIGSFQTGNIKNIVKICDRIESFSSIKMLEKVIHEAKKRERKIEYYAQINIGKESQKNGFAPEEMTSEFAKYFKGIMSIPPAYNSYIYFPKIQETANAIGISQISMGMSGDYKKAIESGATEIRIGTLIFGNKKK